jgi:hypothetical protein
MEHTEKGGESLQWNLLMTKVIRSLPESVIDQVRNGRHAQAGKTHCSYGHELTSENTCLYQLGTGRWGRWCRECGRLNSLQNSGFITAASSVALNWDLDRMVAVLPENRLFAGVRRGWRGGQRAFFE